MKNRHIGVAITGSFCTFSQILPVIQQLVEGGNAVTPILSYAVSTMDTRFYKAKDFYNDLVAITGRAPILEIADAEPIGPSNHLDAMVILPCTGNTLAKLNNAITDTPVLMAAKAHIRNNKPLVIAVSTNDALSQNFKNIGELLNKKNIFFVPFSQDDPVKKPASLVAHFDKVEQTLELAIQKTQIQPILP